MITFAAPAITPAPIAASSMDFIPAAKRAGYMMLFRLHTCHSTEIQRNQFATGLTGTRSPYGAVRGARDPARISGGSSSGSAVAVALGLCDLALGTDTAGSGRVPAALNGIVGVKPTRGVIPTAGVVPACRSLDW